MALTLQQRIMCNEFNGTGKDFKLAVLDKLDNIEKKLKSIEKRLKDAKL